ncbi:MAG: SIS domain-containing protein [Pseudomonadota bacterium]|nr:SIS domain-containing protein [Pseudomonadota bacterium]
MSETDVPSVRPMLADLRRQSEALKALAARYPEFSNRGRTLVGNGKERIVAFGSGDGWFAARAAADYARFDLGLPFEAASSLETLSYVAPRHVRDDIAAVAISMSGSADRTNEAAQALRADGKPVLALTNGSGGELARIAGAKISLDVADLAPFLTGTTKYTATLLGLIMLLEGAAGVAAPSWTAYLQALPRLLTEVEAFAQKLTERFVGRAPTGVRILSAGPNLATAEYGMAKLIKLLPLPVWADEIEEFAHRQFWSCPATDWVIYIVTNPAVARCASASAAALGSMGMTTVAIDTPECAVTGATARFTLPSLPERLSPLFGAIPLQFIGYYLARAFGANPDQSQEVGDPARFRAAQLLARRGELR